ncbi:hypothetical protein Tco_0513943 [Tanacetum coccineum]
MTTLAEFMTIAGANNRPPMLEKSLYDLWKSRMERYIENRENERMILNSVQNVPLVWPTVVEEDGLPPDVYAIVNHHKVAKEIWDRVKLLMQGTKLSLQEKECKLYDEFDKFSFVKGETLYHLPPEWSKFVTDVKLARDLHTTNYDQLYSYLEQHEAHANETRLMRERYQDPLAFVANYNQSPSQLNNYHSQYNSTHHSSVPPSQQYQSHQTSSVPPIAYNSPQSSTQPLTEFPQMDSGLVVPVFNQGDDPIACLNKAMAFLTAVASSRFPSTNNQLRTSSNPRNQATIQDGRVTMQQVQGRQGQSYADNSYKGTATSSRGNNEGAQIRVKTIPNTAAFQTEDLDAYDSDCDDVSNAKAVLMANLSKYGSDVISVISPPKDAETPVESPIPISPSSSVGSSSPFRSTTPPPDYPFDKSILDNSLWIIPQPLGSKPVLEKPNKPDAC